MKALIGEPAPMPKNRQRYLRARYCRRQASYLWGQKRIIKPVLLPIQFGDGRQIFALRPITTRTHHYVIAINSTPDWFSRDCTTTLHDDLDAIYEEIEGQFGRCLEEDDDLEEGQQPDDPFKVWPAFCYQVGTEWWGLSR